MRSSDELEEEEAAGRTGTTEGPRPSPPSGNGGDPLTAGPSPAGVDLPGPVGPVATVAPSEVGISVSSIANLTTALITNTIPLTVLQNGLALNTSMVVLPSMFQNANPALVEFKGQGAQILPGDLGLRLVTNPGFRPPTVIGLQANSAAIPIKRETGGDDDLLETDEDSIDDQEWSSPGGALHSDDSAIDYSVTAPNSSSALLGANCATKKLRTGSRRSCKDAKLTPEEEERRKLRRERNKLAAAKCRQKRVDQTNELLAETQVLEEEQSHLEEEIKKYQQQKEELEFILEAHRLQCGLGKQAALVPPAPSKPASSSSSLHLPSESVPVAKTEASEEPGKDPRAPAVQGPLVVPAMQRPTSFPLVSRPLQPGLSQALGLPISTPSGGVVITLGFDSMLDGRTGLTPVTGFPSIVVQTPQNPMSDIALPPSSGATTPASTALVSL